LEEVPHLAAYTTAVLQSSRGEDENGAAPQPAAVSVIALCRASIHRPQAAHARTQFAFHTFHVSILRAPKWAQSSSGPNSRAVGKFNNCRLEYLLAKVRYI
jgi:hypothetical protein